MRIKIASIILLAFLSTFASAVTINDLELASGDQDQAIIIDPYQMQLYDKEIITIYRKILKPQDDMATRINKISQHFIGRPYLLDALGEGQDAEFDQDPIYRTDAFDCTTLAEMTLALAEAHNLQEFQSVVQQVRYKEGQPVYVMRNHFMSVDWNVVNQRQGFLQDITDQLGVPYEVAVTNIDKPNWFRHLTAKNLHLLSIAGATQTTFLLAKLHSYADDVSVETSHYKYIPLEEIYKMQNGNLIVDTEFFAKIPSGTIIEIVRPNLDLTKEIGTHLNVIHMGLAIRTKQGLMFRQASSRTHKVFDMPLEKYLAYYYLSKNIPPVGINVQKILDKPTATAVASN